MSPFFSSTRLLRVLTAGSMSRRGGRSRCAEHLRATTCVFACTVSGGLVALPATFLHVGIIPALLLSLVAGATSGLSLLALSTVSDRSGGLSTYGEVARFAFGPVCACVVDATIGLFLIGVLAGSLIVIRNWLSTLLLGQHGMLHARLATTAVACFGIFPLALPRSIGVLAYASTVSISAFTLLVGVLVAYGCSALISGDHWEPAPARSPWWPDDLNVLKLGQAFNPLAYTFACQFQLMAIYQDLRARIGSGTVIAASAAQNGGEPLALPADFLSPSAVSERVQGEDEEAQSVPQSGGSSPNEPAKRSRSSTEGSPESAVRFRGVLVMATCAMLLLFGLTGVFGVLAFPNTDINGNILVTLEGKPLGQVTYGCLCLGVALAAPLLVHPARSCLSALAMPLLNGMQRQGGHGVPPHGVPEQQPQEVAIPLVVHVILTAFIVGTALIVALFVDQIMVLISYLGAFAICPLGLAFPAITLLCLPHALKEHEPARGQLTGASSSLNGGGSIPSQHGLIERLMPTRTGDGDMAVARDSSYTNVAQPRRCQGRNVLTYLLCAWLICVACLTLAIEITNIALRPHHNVSVLGWLHAV